MQFQSRQVSYVGPNTNLNVYQHCIYKNIKMTEKTGLYRQRRDFLKNSAPFSQLSNNLLKKIASRLQVHHYGVGQTICERGEKGDCLYIIHSGSVVEILSDDGREEITVAILKKGDCFGTISLLTDEAYFATIKVKEDVEIFVICKDDLKDLISKNPILNTYLSRIVSSRIKLFLEFFKKEKSRVFEEQEDKFEKERKLEVINRVSKLFHRDEDINKTLSMVVKEVNKEMKSDACSIYLLDEITNNLVLEAGVGFDRNAIGSAKMGLDEGITGWVVRNGEPATVENTHDDPRVKFISEIHEDRLSSILSVPLGDKSNVIGAINIQTVEKRKYTYDDISSLAILANHINLAISNARLKKRIQISERVSDKKELKSMGFVGKGKYIDSINSFISSVITHDTPVLINGENGSGKVPTAKIIHYRGKRNKGPFVEVDCRDINNDSWGEEIFGYEKASYIISCDDAIGNAPQEKGPSGSSAEDIATRLGYLELADSGTIFFNHIDKLNQANQIKLLNYLQDGKFRRVNGNENIFSNVRIISSVSEDVSVQIEKGRFDGNLYKILGQEFFHLKALRNQKRSIPMLSKHFVKNISKEMHKDVKNITESAIGKLMSYDWPGNVVELENVLRHAILLAKDNTITSEEIFFGKESDEKRWAFDLLTLNPLKKLFLSKFYPQGLQIISIIFLVIALCILFLGNKDGLMNFASVFLWSAGLFGMYFMTLFTGRSLCGICPFVAVGDWVQRLKSLNLQVPKVLINYGRYVTIASIILIFWIEGITLMPRSSIFTASLLIFVLLGAVVSSLLFERRVWCRYICPLGGMIGVYSLSSVVSLKANKNVCLNHCETHDCYLGKKEVPGCPMSLHPYALESGRDCVLCMNCYKNCDHSSIKVNLQSPGSDIGGLSTRYLSDSLLSLSFLGVLLVEYKSLLSIDSRLFQFIYNNTGINQTVLYSIIFIFVLASPFVCIGFFDYILNGFLFNKVKERLTDFGLAAIPLALMGHLAFYGDKLKESFWKMLKIAHIYSPVRTVNEYGIANYHTNGITTFELLVILLGLAGSVYVFYLISKKTKHILTRTIIGCYLTTFAFFALIYVYIIKTN